MPLLLTMMGHCPSCSGHTGTVAKRAACMNTLDSWHYLKPLNTNMWWLDGAPAGAHLAARSAGHASPFVYIVFNECVCGHSMLGLTDLWRKREAKYPREYSAIHSHCRFQFSLC